MKKLLFLFLLLNFFSNTGKSQSTMTGREVYEFNINDEFQYKTANIPPNAQRYVIIAKRFSADSSTVFYTRSYNNYGSSVDYTGGPHLVYSFTSGIDSVSYSNLDSTLKNNYMVDSCNTASDTSFISQCNVQIYQRDHCAACCFEGQYYSESFGRGLGQVSNYYSYPAYSVINNNYLFYYTKGTVTCGTKDTTSANVSVNYISKNSGLLFFPSPARNILNVSNIISQTSIKIYDLLGNLLIETKTSGDISLDITNLVSGVYSVVTSTGAGNICYRLVVCKD